MITHEIKKDSPQSIFQAARETVRRLISHQPLQQQDSSSRLDYMGKLQFAEFIEKQKKEWPKGSYAALATLSSVEKRIPAPLFRITDHQEIAWNAPLDYVHKEPKCLYIMNDRYAYTPIAYPPSALRHLTDEEQALVDIRDKSKPAYEAKGDEELYFDDTIKKWTLLDRRTKKVLRTFPRS